MPKTPQSFLTCHPWAVVEDGFHPDHALVAESIFALGNEFMGVRGYFEEGTSGKTHVGSFFNGIYEKEPLKFPKWFPGNPTDSTSVANAVNWLHTRLSCGDEQLDVGVSQVSDFRRVLDLRTGLLQRSFVWETRGGAALALKFERLLAMETAQCGYQRISIEHLRGPEVALRLEWALDGTTVHQVAKKSFWGDDLHTVGEHTAFLQRVTHNTRHRTSTTAQVSLEGGQGVESATLEQPGIAGGVYTLRLAAGAGCVFERRTAHSTERDPQADAQAVAERSRAEHAGLLTTSFAEALAANERYWASVWEHADVIIEGDAENQQGIRYCIYQLYQTYHGYDANLNIGAKGLTGEVYWGGTWWDTETYCLPFYLLNNPEAARNLLLWRHKVLPGAKERAIQHDCVGARFPMCTVDGTETCIEWQHGDLEIHVSAAVAYGLWHYSLLTGDDELLFGEGVELLVEISRFYASRGSWSPLTKEYGFWGVMGADEFHMMAHNNAYTNIMAAKSFDFCLKILGRLERERPERYGEVVEALKLEPAEREDWERKARAMRTNFHAESKLYEQHDGFFDLPHLDLSKLPPDQFPLYAHWAYINLFRYDMIKQPDVLLLMLFFAGEYDLETKRANFNYYEPRCSHESSLSPGVHSILAAELGYLDKARDYFLHATRLDLDNYNRNTHEGLHTTSMAGAWLNIVYGWGGLRTDGEVLRLAPTLPTGWQALQFQLTYRGSQIRVRLEAGEVLIQVVSGPQLKLELYGEAVTCGADPLRHPLQSPASGPHGIPA